MAGFHLHFSLQIYYRLSFFIHTLEPIVHLSRVRSNALKIAAITGSRQSSTLLTAQPGANQMSSFAWHNSQPARSNCSITCLLPFSGHCFSFWIHLDFLLLLGSFHLSFPAASTRVLELFCLIYHWTIWLIWLMNSIQMVLAINGDLLSVSKKFIFFPTFSSFSFYSVPSPLPFFGFKLISEIFLRHGLFVHTGAAYMP